MIVILEYSAKSGNKTLKLSVKSRLYCHNLILKSKDILELSTQKCFPSLTPSPVFRGYN